MASKKKEEKKGGDDAVVTIDLNKFLVPLAIVVAGVMISAVIFFTNGDSDGDSDTTSPSVQGAVDDGSDDSAGGSDFEPASTTIDDDPIKGNKDANVYIVEFSDYECPFCQRHYQQTYPSIVENYIDSGDVALVFRDYPLGFHPQAIPAANAANCAREQGGDDTYFEYHDALFNGDVASADRDTYVSLASDIGLDTGEFGNCIDEDKWQDEIDNDLADGSDAGVSGTPGFVIGTIDDDGVVTGKRVAGAYPYSDFEALIEEFLNQ